MEHVDGIDPNIVSLARDADLLVHDAQFTPEELKAKKGWGHSSWEQAIEVAEQAGVKRLALFHHEPNTSDEEIWDSVELAEAYLMHRHARSPGCEVFVAYDGLSLEI